MKVQNARFFLLGLLLGATVFVMGLAGCATTDYQKAMIAPDLSTNLITAKLAPGDTIMITLSGLPEDPQAQEKPINDDGSITLSDIGRIQAAGKTTGELEDYIHSLYVPAIYRHLNVTVKITGENRVYFVRGEVKSPGRLVYVGSLTVTKAITSAGDFTDFANHARVYLIRSNGQRFKLDCDKILDGREPDPPVFPNDQIEVKRRRI